MKTAAADMNWDRDVHHRLSPHEWPDGALEWMAPRVILELSSLRKQAGVPMYPSPVLGAHVRHRTRRAGDGDRHATDNGSRLSDATDFFVRWGDAPAVYRLAQAIPGIRGIGIYDAMMLRGTPGDFCMFHIDAPDEHAGRALWVGHGREPVEYVSQATQPGRYYALLSQMLNERK